MRRPQEFFAQVYTHLLDHYKGFLSDRRTKGEEKEWESLLYMMDSTTISLFDNILKGVDRHPKSGKKKGGMKVHTLLKYQVGVPMVIQLTSAAKHDHYLLKEVHLPKESLHRLRPISTTYRGWCLLCHEDEEKPPLCRPFFSHQCQ